MSAFLCSPLHIASLAFFANRNKIHLHARPWENPEATTDVEPITRALALANLESINTRYPSHANEQEDKEFISDCIAEIKKTPKQFTAVEIIKNAQCFDYQACEYDAWNKSDAKALIDAIITKAITQLPGYESAPWGI